MKSAKTRKAMTEVEVAQEYRLMQAQQIIDWVSLQDGTQKARRRAKAK